MLIWGLALRAQLRAKAFIADVKLLVLDTSTFAEAQQLAAKYSGLPWYTSDTDMSCTAQRCDYRFCR